jgi:hypothetical protein
MEIGKRMPRLGLERWLPAAITCAILCTANYGLDVAFDWYGLPTSKTILNDLIIGILGAVAVFYYLSASQEGHNFRSAKERIVLIGEMNARIRESLGVVTSAALSEDRMERLRGIDQAMDRIDEILCDFRTETKAGG